MRSVQRAIVVPVLFVVALLCAGVARAADGGIYLYLQPLPSEAARLTFTIGSIAAVNGAGTESALKVNLSTVNAAQVSRQRLLASGRVSYGSYAGFTIAIRQAALKADRGESALTVPDAPVRLDVPFVVSDRPTVIWLALNYQASVSPGFTFSPVLVAMTPTRPIADHMGFASTPGGNAIAVFDKDLGQVVSAIDVCAGPAGMALDQHRRRLYVACAKDDEVRSLDVASGELVDRARLTPGDRPGELALTPDGSTLISVNAGSNSISFYDALSLVRRERVNVGSGPSSVVVEPSGRRAFVLNTLSSSISVIDLAAHALTATLSTESSPLRAQFSSRGDRLYVIHDRSPYMTVFDSRQLTLVTRARLRTGVSALAVDTVRDLICVAGDGDASVDVYDPNALMPVYSLRSRNGASFMVFDPEQNDLYLVSARTRTVAVARLSTRKLMSEMDVADAPYGVAVMGGK